MRILIAKMGQSAFKVTIEETKQSYMEASLKSALRLADKLKSSSQKGKIQ